MNTLVDWMGNEIKEGHEVCFIKIKTGGYFRNASFFIPDGSGGHTEHKIPDDPEEDCWEVGEYLKIIKDDNGILVYDIKGPNYSGRQLVCMLGWYVDTKYILAIKGVSDTKQILPIKNDIMTKKNLFENYPIVDGHRSHYLHYPVQKINRKWVAADVLPDGFISVENNPVKTEFDTKEECQKGCDIHNNFHGWDKETANNMVSQSMENSALKEKVN